MRTIERVDCHHHLWDVERFDYPWLKPDADRPRALFPDLTAIAGSYRVGDYIADARSANIVKSVHIDGGYVPRDPVGETRYLQSVADRHGFPHGIVARAALEEVNVQQILEAQCQFRNIRGVRHILNWHADADKRFTSRPDWMSDPSWLRGFAYLRRYELSFDLQIYPGQMAAAAGLARRFPSVAIILNHAGMPLGENDGDAAFWRAGMRRLAANDNVSVKISGLGMTIRNWTIERIRPWVLDTIDIFGPHRTMFASNFPVDKLYGSFATLYSAFDDLTAGFSLNEVQDMFFNNAQRIYRL
ncbi:amidohydrolase family protein [Sodalis ligni]|jgi:predicted TIM-barrel fold metal-dependent hydrolase|uniref:Putative TIM-barrel fold metal-dependent hydrolase n=1 Tax=Sodalis ligni TaxID=2697027 RepID=A0A4R1N7J7_9GAMM|nr:amidohydrolase family protein [Sodalis ligni]TCL03153.1 putative TIM-barrel fold metal-dependent hydrolase [Sodalis ligni]